MRVVNVSAVNIRKRNSACESSKPCGASLNSDKVELNQDIFKRNNSPAFKADIRGIQRFISKITEFALRNNSDVEANAAGEILKLGLRAKSLLPDGYVDYVKNAKGFHELVVVHEGFTTPEIIPVTVITPQNALEFMRKFVDKLGHLDEQIKMRDVSRLASVTTKLSDTASPENFVSIYKALIEAIFRHPLSLTSY